MTSRTGTGGKQGQLNDLQVLSTLNKYIPALVLQQLCARHENASAL